MGLWKPSSSSNSSGEKLAQRSGPGTRGSNLPSPPHPMISECTGMMGNWLQKLLSRTPPPVPSSPIPHSVASYGAANFVETCSLQAPRCSTSLWHPLVLLLTRINPRGSPLQAQFLCSECGVGLWGSGTFSLGFSGVLESPQTAGIFPSGSELRVDQSPRVLSFSLSGLFLARPLTSP